MALEAHNSSVAPPFCLFFLCMRACMQGRDTEEFVQKLLQWDIGELVIRLLRRPLACMWIQRVRRSVSVASCACVRAWVCLQGRDTEGLCEKEWQRSRVFIIRGSEGQWCAGGSGGCARGSANPRQQGFWTHLFCKPPCTLSGLGCMLCIRSQRRSILVCINSSKVGLKAQWAAACQQHGRL